MSIHIPVPEPKELILPGRFNMPELLIPGRKPMQPFIIDWNHWAAKGLIRAFFFVGGDLRDYVTNIYPLVNGTSHSNRGLEQTGTEVITWEAQTNLPFSVQKGTLVHDFQSNGNTPFASARFVEIDANGIEWRRQNADTNVRIILNSTTFTISTPDLWDQERHTLAVRWDASIGTDGVGFLIDGAETNLSTAFSDIALTDNLHLLNREDGTRNAEGRMTYFLAYNESKSFAEIREIQKNPYQFLKPAIEVKYMPDPELEFLSLPNRLNLPELLIPKRTPKSWQVEVDWTNPFTADLLSCFIWDSFAPHDLAGKVPDSAVTIGGSAVIIDQNHLYFDRTASNEITIADANTDFELFEDIDLSWAAMHVFRFDADAVSDGDQYTLHQTNQGSNTNLNIDLNTVGMTLYDGQIHCVILTAELFGSTGNTMDLWLDGILLGSVAVPSSRGKSSRLRYVSNTNVIESSIGVGDSTNLTIGGTTQFGTDRWHGHLMSFISWLRFLPRSEAKLLSADPYQFLIPATKTHIPYEPNKVLDGFWLSDPRFEMPSLFIPGRKPVGPVEIDWSHPLAKNLQLVCWPENSHELVHGYPIIPLLGAITKISNRDGVSFDTNSGDSIFELVGSEDLSLGADESLSIVMLTFTVGAGEETFIGKVSDDDIYNWVYYKENNGTSFGLGAVSAFDDPEEGASILDKWVQIALVYDGDTRTTHYHDSILDRTSTLIDDDPSTIANPIGIGADWNSYPTTVNFPLNAKIPYIFVWYGRELTAGEIKSLYEDPYQFLIPA